MFNRAWPHWPMWDRERWGAGRGGHVPVFHAFTADDDGKMVFVKTGVGDGAVSRATERMAENWEGVYYSVNAYEIAWHGGRNVENLLRYSEDLENAVWDQSSATVSGNEITFNSSSANFRQLLSEYTFSSGGDAVSTTEFTLTPEYKRYSVYGNFEGLFFILHLDMKSGTTDSCGLRIYCSTVSGLVVRLLPVNDYSGHTIFANKVMLEDVTARTEKTIPSEYQATDTIAAGNPTGRAVYNCENPNTVTDNVVTLGPRVPLAEIPWASGAPAATNACLQNRNLAVSPWVNHGSIATVARNIVGIDGSPNTACVVSDPSNSGVAFVKQSITVSADTNPLCAVYWIRKAVSIVGFAEVHLRNSADISGNGIALSFDATNGDAATRLDSESATWEVSEHDIGGVDWWRILIEQNNTNSSTVTLAYSPMYSSTLGGNQALTLTGDGPGIDCLHLFVNKTIAEVRGLPLIPTEGSSVAVEADDPYTDILNHGDNAEVCYYLEWVPSYDYDDKSNGISILSLRAGGQLGLCYDHATDGTLTTYDGTSASHVQNLTYSAGDTIKFGIRASIADNEMSLCVDGTWGTVVAYDGYVITSTLQMMVSSYEMKIRDLRRYDITGAASQKSKIDALMAE